MLRFWLDRGVDGFRVDAIQTLFEKEHLQDEPPSGLEGFTSVQDSRVTFSDLSIAVRRINVV